MGTMRSLARPVARVVAVVFLLTVVPQPAVLAGMVGTDALCAASERDRVLAFVERRDVAAQLVAQGVAPADVAARVSALTDAELSMLAARIDELPAGGDPAIVFLLLLLLMVIQWIGIDVEAAIGLKETPPEPAEVAPAPEAQDTAPEPAGEAPQTPAADSEPKPEDAAKP